MKIPADPLLRRATGMKDGGATCGGNAGQFKFLERTRWHGGDLRPMLDPLRHNPARLADFAVGRIVLALKCEKLQRQLGELRIADCGLRIGNQPAQADGEMGKFRVHAVFVRGWFSATAEKHDNTKPRRCK